MKLYQIYFLNESKWSQLLKLGKLSKPALRRIQQYRGGPDKYYIKQLLKTGQFKKAEEYLSKRGIVKPARQWLAGVEKGSNNILKKLRVKVYKDADSEIGEYAEKKLPAKIHISKTLTRKRLPDSIIAKRHETDEIRSYIKDVKRLKNQDLAGAVSSNRQGLLRKSGQSSNATGNHNSQEVLRREKELTDTANSLYGRKSKPIKLNKYRKSSKEYDFLKSKKDIRKFDKKTTNELRIKDPESLMLVKLDARLHTKYQYYMNKLNIKQDKIVDNLKNKLLKKGISKEKVDAMDEKLYDKAIEIAEKQNKDLMLKLRQIEKKSNQIMKRMLSITTKKK